MKMEKIVYQDGTYTLGERDGLAWLEVDGESLKLTGQPYEPCTYVTQADGKVTTIHNAFDPSVVLEVFADGETMPSITGRVYRPKDFCTVKEWGPQGVQIDEAERNYIKALKGEPLQFSPIDQGSIKLAKAKTLMPGVKIGELPLDLIRYLYVIQIQEHAQGDFSVFGQLSDDDYYELRHYNDITDWDPLEGDISPKKKPLTLDDYKAFASKHPLCSSPAGTKTSFSAQDLEKSLIYSRE